MAVKVHFYQHSSDLLQLDFVKINDPITVVCPDPSTADDLRFLLAHVYPGSSINVTTINQFECQELRNWAPLEIFDQRKSKAEILMILGATYKLYFPQGNIENFLHAYKLFSELRSYSLDLQLCQEYLSLHPPAVQSVVSLFYRIMPEMKLLDEFSSYSYLSAIYRQDSETENVQRRQIIFWNFKHLSALQIDWLKAMGEIEDVFVPFPREVFYHTQSTDWIYWLHPEKLEDLEEQSLVGHPGSYQLVSFHHGRLSESLKYFFDQQRVEVKDCSIVLV
ncbi:MAG: hypothetical protein WCG27_07400, partial [Pseudomonadota bacterium]